jgi:hypothetical protein
MAKKPPITPMTGNRKVYNPGKDVKGKGAKKAVKKAYKTLAKGDVDVARKEKVGSPKFDAAGKKGDKAEATLQKYKTPGRVYGKKLDKAVADLQKARGKRVAPRGITGHIPRVNRNKSRRLPPGI